MPAFQSLGGRLQGLNKSQAVEEDRMAVEIRVFGFAVNKFGGIVFYFLLIIYSLVF